MPLNEAVKRLRAYHENFDGDTCELCEICEGLCERHLISCLVPGEVEVIAAYLNISPQEFVERYTDSIQTGNSEVVVLQLCSKCPFIDEEFQCTIKPVKPIMCDIYPVYAEVDESGKVEFVLDPACPLSHFPPAARSFREKCIPALKRLQVDADVYAAIEEFDCLMYDFDKFDSLRAYPQQRVIHSLKDVIARTADRSPGCLADLFTAAGKGAISNRAELAGIDSGLASLADMLIRSEGDQGLWPSISRQATILQDSIKATEDVEYLTAIKHLAQRKQLGASQQGQMHQAVVRAALCRIPESQREHRLYKWIEKQVG